MVGFFLKKPACSVNQHDEHDFESQMGMQVQSLIGR